MSEAKNSNKGHDKILTVKVHYQTFSPRTFKVPLQWVYRASVLAWVLFGISLVSSIYALKEYYSERSARPELVKDLENEIQELKIALEKKDSTPSTTHSKPVATDTKAVDTHASDQKAPPAPGEVIEGKEGIWTGLAANITVPPPGTSPLKLEDPRLDWQGKYANFTLNVLFTDPGKGSQQGYIVVLGRANDRIFAHPEGVLNTLEANTLFDPNRGEYFSVARFRVLKARLGPFETPKQLSEIQVFFFDLNKKLIGVQSYPYGNK